MKYILTKLKHLLLAIIVYTYILFETIIWDLIAEPIYTKIKSLNYIKNFMLWIEFKANEYIVLFIFIFSFALAEGMGLYSVKLMGEGKVSLSVLIYLSKIPFAVLSFGVLNKGKEKLNSFYVFNVIYTPIIKIIDFLKSTYIYKKALLKIKEIKEKLVKIKENLGEKRNKLKSLIKTLYMKNKGKFYEK